MANITMKDIEGLAHDIPATPIPINKHTELSPLVQKELPTRDELIATHDEVKTLSLQLLDKKASRTKTDEQIRALQKKLNLAKGHLWDIENRLASMRI